MKTQTKQTTPNNIDLVKEAQKLDLNIDKVLEAQYENRSKYNIFKRMIIQKRYKEAFESALSKKYNDASTKVD